VGAGYGLTFKSLRWLRLTRSGVAKPTQVQLRWWMTAVRVISARGALRF